jgi:Holliday junction resolvasome RuvABC ATP-dependent DNA helicase subunit
MKNKTSEIINTDVHGEFLNDINLWKIIGNKTTVNKLQVLVNEYQNNASEGRRQKIKNVILHGKTGIGKTVIAHAYSNSLCCSQMYEADGTTLSMGGECIYRFLQYGNDNSSYLIHNAEKLTHYSIHILNTVLKTNVLVYHDFAENQDNEFDFNKLLILSTTDISRVNSEIVKDIDVICSLNEKYADAEIFNIILQRISYLSWGVKDKEKIVESIVRVVNGDVYMAIKVLGWSHSCARSVGADIITLQHLNKSLHLLQ